MSSRPYYAGEDVRLVKDAEPASHSECMLVAVQGGAIVARVRVVPARVEMVAL